LIDIQPFSADRPTVSVQDIHKRFFVVAEILCCMILTYDMSIPWTVACAVRMLNSNLSVILYPSSQQSYRMSNVGAFNSGNTVQEIRNFLCHPTMNSQARLLCSPCRE
jgi:hypothetical protein